MSSSVIELQVVGMSCSSCVRHVREGLRKVPGVTAVDVELEQARARVTHDGSAPTEALIAAVVDAGYGATAAA